MKITRRQLRKIIKESTLPDSSLAKIHGYYIGRKADHLQAISLADGLEIDHADLIGQIMDWLNKGGHGNADSDGYEFAMRMGYNFMEFYGDNHPVDSYAFAPYEREFEEGAYDYLVDEERKNDTGPQGYDEDMSRGERYKIEEGMDLDPSFYSDAPSKYQNDEDYDFVMTIVEVLSEYPAAHSYLDIEEVANEIIIALESKGLI